MGAGIESSDGKAQTVVALVLALFGIVVLFTAVAISLYYYAFETKDADGKLASGGNSIADRIRRANRSLRGSTTEAAKITSVSFVKWNHVGPLYPRSNEPPGYVQSSSLEFRRDLTAQRETKKDFDRDLPDEIARFSGSITEEQFTALAEACSQNDIINEPDSTETRSEGGASLRIEYDGGKKQIVTSNIGRDTDEVTRVISAISHLEKAVRWAPVR